MFASKIRQLKALFAQLRIKVFLVKQELLQQENLLEEIKQSLQMLEGRRDVLLRGRNINFTTSELRFLELRFLELYSLEVEILHAQQTYRDCLNVLRKLQAEHKSSLDSLERFGKKIKKIIRISSSASDLFAIEETQSLVSTLGLLDYGNRNLT